MTYSLNFDYDKIICIKSDVEDFVRRGKIKMIVKMGDKFREMLKLKVDEQKDVKVRKMNWWCIKKVLR